MGRPKSYNREELLTRAMARFWTDGFHATSARDLAAAAGVNVASLYAEFGSKQGVYTAVLSHYEQAVVSQFFGPLEAPDASIATLRATLRQFPEMARLVAVAPGCLLTNAAIEHAPTPAASQEAMARYIARVAAGIQHALGNTQRDHELDPEATRAFAHQLVAVLIGLFVMTRAQTDHAILDDVVASAIAQIDAFACAHGIDELAAN